MVFPSFIIKENKFRSTIEIHEDTLTRHWIADGELKQSANTLMAKLYSADSTKVSIPYITRRFGAKVTFDTLSYSMTKESNGKNQLYLNGKAKVNGLDIFHKVLSPEVIHLDRGHLGYQMNISDHSFELDSTTTLYSIKFRFILIYEPKRKKIYGISLQPLTNHGFRQTSCSVLCPKACSTTWKVSKQVVS